VHDNVFQQLLINAISVGCLYALMAVGFALIYNTSRIFHVAHGAVYTITGYLCYFFLLRLHWGTAVAVVMSILCSAILGAIIEIVIYAPLARKKAPLTVCLLSSVGLYIALSNIVVMIFGSDTKLLRPDIEKVYHFSGIVLTRIQLCQVVVSVCLIGLTLLVLRYTNLGRKMRAVRDNPTLTIIMGVNQRQVRLAVFALGSALAGTAAVLAALDVGVDPNMGMPALLTAAVALIVGGVGSFEGAAVGGLTLGLLQALVIWRISARWTDALTFTVLVLFLLCRPRGLFGIHRRLEEETT